LNEEFDMLNKAVSQAPIHKGGTRYPVRYVLPFLLLVAGQGRAQVDLPTFEIEALLHGGNTVQSMVEFDPPFTWTYPVTSLARILVANRASGELVPQSAPYTLIIPVGLQVYRDPARSVPTVTGQTLMTRATGYDTLWAACAQDIVMDRAFVLSIMGSAKTMQLTYRLPSSIRSRFQRDKWHSFEDPFIDALGRIFHPNRVLKKHPSVDGGRNR
jgi:hypothetical protein